MALAYSAITIIYNPVSTGASKRNAFELRRQLQAAGLGDITKTIPTKYANHAEKLAYRLAKASQHPLIISSSGDGGYNEVVNGALQAQAEGAHPVCGLLPSGNANDHYHSAHTEPLIKQIMAGEQLQIDVLRIQSTINGQPWSRYAHSYIGVGLTPKVGQELNKTRLNRFREAWIVARTLYGFKPTTLLVNGKERSYDSLIFSNVGKMSKVLSLSNTSELTDGKFELIAFRTHSRSYLLKQLVQAATLGLRNNHKRSTYSFTTIGKTHIQLDGEIFTLDNDALVTVDIQSKALRCTV